MGTSRVNTSVLDLKCHSAATTLKITENHDGTEPQFTLQKWVSSEHESTKLEDKNEHTQDSDTKSSGTAAGAASHVDNPITLLAIGELTVQDAGVHFIDL
ncbi:hypothetical protein TSUD_309580 [Trifolium subterraneum]|uniref:Uncharacterized protein n=1 Tax=Trifolium subterraneum TaxID=3900 RepID=A0A2Z6LS11_TRISU|nr:hypothetical protein TSUD_309580 [Trifolium subterraneum]